MKKLTFLLFCLLAGIGLVSAQTTRVTGTVLSAEDGEPLVGVTVIVKGTGIGTQTDVNGSFTFTNVPAGATTLSVSYIGMQPLEVAIKPSLSIIMNPDTQTLDEVVVTAFGISREKKALGYATQEVKSEILTMAGNTDLTKALQGKVAGVDLKTSSGMPGASSQIIIRGARSFDGDNTPLYVVDGMPIASTAYYGTGNSVTGPDMANRAIDLDPNDIESINVLKGQAAAALYGLRASNGAIIITTKSGKGKMIGKTNVSVSQTVAFDQVSRTPDYQKVWAQGMSGSYVWNNSSSWGPKITDLPNDPVYGGNSQNHTGKYRVNQLTQAGVPVDEQWVTPGVYDNWNDYFRTGVSSTTSAMVSRAESTGNFAIGLSYTDQTGIALKTGMSKWNAKMNADKKLGEHFMAGFSVNFSKSKIDKLSGANQGSLMGVLSAPPSYNLKGIPYHLPGDPYTQIYYRGGSFDNPYWVPHNNTFDENTIRLFGNMFGQYNTRLAPGHGLTIKYQLGTDTYTTHNQDIFGYGHAANRGGMIEYYGVTKFNYNSLLTAIYDWKITPGLDLNVIVGNEVDHSYDKTYDIYGEDMNFGGWIHIQNANTTEVSERQWQDRSVGFFGNMSLTYQNMVYLTASMRKDVVSYMPPNRRSFTYPSVSLSFIFTELEAFKNLNWFSFGKIRGSYAEVGQVTSRYLNNYYYRPSYGGGFWTGNPIIYPLQGVNTYIQYPIMYDPLLKPQNTKSWELGLQLSFFKERIGIDYTYSDQNTVDQIFAVPLPGSTGASDLVTNGGQMKTAIHELILNVTPVRTRDFRWDINLNYTKINNKCISLREGVESIMLGGFVTPQVRAGVGASYPIIYGGQYAKDELGRILVDENPNSMTYGMPMAGEPGELGQASPKFIVGGGTTLTYKSLSLGATFEWKQGGRMYSGTNGLMDLYGISKRTEDRESTFIFKGYKADGTPNDIVRGGPADPRAYQILYNTVLGNIDEAYIYGNAFIKLREITLRYALPKSFIPKVDVSVSAFARNLLLWTELPNADPESGQGNNNMMGSFERFSMPQTKSFGMSLSVNF